MTALNPARGGGNPLCIDLYCGLGGFSEGALAEGYFVVGFDIERHVYGEIRYPAHLVIQDVLTLHGSQFRDAALIVCSPPCQEYSYMAMPFSRGKAKAAAIRADTTGGEIERLNRLFNACFRIQREACEAAGRHIPCVVENVRGAIPWVGRSRWNAGSMHFWGDVPALMPEYRHVKVQAFRFDGSGRSFQTASVRHHDIPDESRWFNDGPRNPDSISSSSSSSLRRKAASAMIAKIPFALSRHIARVFHPGGMGARGEAA